MKSDSIEPGLTSHWRELAATGRLGQFIVLCLGVWLHAADSLLAATVMPDAVAEIGGVAFINWTIALYQLGGIVSGAATGLLCRRFGMRQMLVVAAGLYGVACMASALAPEMGTMLAARLVQGVGGGIMIAITYVATQRMFPPHLWTRLMAIVSAIWGAAALCGPLIGGLFADAGLWRGAFWAFAAQAIILALVAQLYLRQLSPGQPATGRFSWAPLIALSAATLAIAGAGEVHRAITSIGLCLSGMALLYVAARLDRSAPNRLMPDGVLDVRHNVGAGLLMILTLAIGATAFTSYGPLLLQTLFGVSPLVSGYVVAAEAVAWTLATLLTSGTSSDRAERALIRVGAVLVASGGVGLALVFSNGSITLITGCVVLQGAGFGMSWPYMMRRIVSAAAGPQQDLAAPATSTVQRIGYAVGASASGIAANAAGFAEGTSIAAAHAASFWVFAAFVPVLAIGCLAALLITRSPAH